MWAFTMNHHIMNSINKEKDLEITKLQQDNKELLDKNNELQKELDFRKQIHTFYGSLVGNMYIKKKNGENIWIDRLRLPNSELLELDKDEDVVQWLEDINIKYKDNDW